MIKNNKSIVWNVSISEAVEIQNTLCKKIVLRTHKKLSSLKRIAAIDISMGRKSDLGFGSIVVLSYPELKQIELKNTVGKLRFPYISGFLSFREGPITIELIKKVCSNVDLYIFDGQGIAHPRMMGIATHIGVLLNLCTIGCAKSRLVGIYKEPADKLYSYSKISFKGNTVGAVVRSRVGVKPIFVSPGNRISLEDSLTVVKNCLRGFRIPEPVRIAHRACNELRKAKKDN